MWSWDGEEGTVRGNIQETKYWARGRAAGGKVRRLAPILNEPYFRSLYPRQVEGYYHPSACDRLPAIQVSFIRWSFVGLILLVPSFIMYDWFR